MEKKINVSELLKDCPTGMELDCTMFEKPVKYKGLTEGEPYIINIETPSGGDFYLTKEGYLYDLPDSKCIIFPKGKTTWEGFVPPCKFKDGDIVAHQNHMGTWIGIYHKHDYLNEAFSSYCCIGRDGKFWACFNNDHGYDKTRLATKEEKVKLFQAIKDNGYKWNAETKTLEKLVVPEFKVGDKITNGKTFITIGYIDDEYYYEIRRNITTRLLIKNQDEWNLIPKRFDLNTLKPLQPVLVRNTNGQVWTMDFFSHKIDTNKGLQPSIVCVGHCPNQCIPYKGNEFLRGTSDECKDFYKTWE